MAGRCIHSNEYQPRARIHRLVFSKPTNISFATNLIRSYSPNYKNRPSNILLAVSHRRLSRGTYELTRYRGSATHTICTHGVACCRTPSESERAAATRIGAAPSSSPAGVRMEAVHAPRLGKAAALAVRVSATAACSSSHCRRSAPSRAGTNAERVLPLRRPDQLCSSDGCCEGVAPAHHATPTRCHWSSQQRSAHRGAAAHADRRRALWVGREGRTVRVESPVTAS